MTVKERDHLLLNVNRAFRDGGEYSRRYDLYSIGESLLKEHRDMSYLSTRQKATALCEGGKLHFSMCRV